MILELETVAFIGFCFGHCQLTFPYKEIQSFFCQGHLTFLYKEVQYFCGHVAFPFMELFFLFL